jgi:hypothetical protein
MTTDSTVIDKLHDTSNLSTALIAHIVVASQKRALFWQSIINTLPEIGKLRVDFQNQLNSYRAFLFEIGTSDSIYASNEEVSKLSMYERILEDLENEVRLEGVART